MISRIRPQGTKTNFACSYGGVWKCNPRTVPLCRENDSFSCTYLETTPNSCKLVSRNVSLNQPRLSENRLGTKIRGSPWEKSFFIKFGSKRQWPSVYIHWTQRASGSHKSVAISFDIVNRENRRGQPPL